MIKFQIPAKLNGEQLIEELIAAGVKINKTDYPYIDGNNDLWLKIETKDETKAKSIISNHIGIDRMPTLADKLSIIGLTIEDLKTALA